MILRAVALIDLAEDPFEDCQFDEKLGPEFVRVLEVGVPEMLWKVLPEVGQSGAPRRMDSQVVACKLRKKIALHGVAKHGEFSLQNLQ